MVFTVDHVHPIFAIDDQGPGAVKLSRLPTRPTPAAEGFPVRCKFLHAMIAELAQVNVPIGLAGQRRVVEQDIVRIIELAKFVALLTP